MVDPLKMTQECPLCSGTGQVATPLLRDRGFAILKTLTFREREILKLRHGMNDGFTYTLDQTAKIFKVTRERIRQVEAKAVRKLQHPVRLYRIKGLGYSDIDAFLAAMRFIVQSDAVKVVDVEEG